LKQAFQDTDDGLLTSADQTRNLLRSSPIQGKQTHVIARSGFRIAALVRTMAQFDLHPFIQAMEK
jgi:hypothetical protein